VTLIIQLDAVTVSIAEIAADAQAYNAATVKPPAILQPVAIATTALDIAVLLLECKPVLLL
jgi:hypothetical protein